MSPSTKTIPLALAGRDVIGQAERFWKNRLIRNTNIE